jgi:hypothetical protein
MDPLIDLYLGFMTKERCIVDNALRPRAGINIGILAISSLSHPSYDLNIPKRSHNLAGCFKSPVLRWRKQGGPLAQETSDADWAAADGVGGTDMRKKNAFCKYNVIENPCTSILEALMSGR